MALSSSVVLAATWLCAIARGVVDVAVDDATCESGRDELLENSTELVAVADGKAKGASETAVGDVEETAGSSDVETGTKAAEETGVRDAEDVLSVSEGRELVTTVASVWLCDTRELVETTVAS